MAGQTQPPAAAVPVAALPDSKREEEFLCPDEPIKDLEEPILHCEDSDYEFFGPNSGKDIPISPSAFALTIIFGILCIFSFFGPSGKEQAGPNVIHTGYIPKSTLVGVEKGLLASLIGFLLDPYLIITLYMVSMIILLLWHDKAWTKAKWRKLIAKLKSHSKTS